MSNAKLMTPLFYQGNFNADGKKMRAILVREVSNGTDTYRLWRRDGKPDRKRPSNTDDAYILYVELGGYLATLGMTDFYLTGHCGHQAAVTALYGDEDKREQYFDSQKPSDGNGAAEALEQERALAQEYGRSPARQADYIKFILDRHTAAYRAAKENSGETPPDYTGALVLGELQNCVELYHIYKDKQRERNWAYCRKCNQLAEKQVQKALRVIREGGVLRNDTVEFYRSRYDFSVCSIFLHLMKLYYVDVPLRVQGWITTKLVSATIADGRCSDIHFWGNKGDRTSQRFVDCMNELIRAVSA